MLSNTIFGVLLSALLSVLAQAKDIKGYITIQPIEFQEPHLFDIVRPQFSASSASNCQARQLNIAMYTDNSTELVEVTGPIKTGCSGSFNNTIKVESPLDPIGGVTTVLKSITCKVEGGLIEAQDVSFGFNFLGLNHKSGYTFERDACDWKEKNGIRLRCDPTACKQLIPDPNNIRFPHRPPM